jgi:dUTPase
MINNDYYGLLNIHVTCANFKVQNVPFIILKKKKLQSVILKGIIKKQHDARQPDLPT